MRRVMTNPDVGRREERVGNHRVDTKRTRFLENRGNAGGERHHTIEEAFAVLA
jgi:hypothetical protein